MESSRAKEHAYTRTCSPLFQQIFQKYNNPNNYDNLTVINSKIDNVKVVMKENVSQALENCVKLERIDEAAADLERQAGMCICVYLYVYICVRVLTLHIL